MKNERIKLLQKELNKINENNINNDNIKNEENLYKNFNINLKNPLCTLDNHQDYIYCLTLLNDGRFASGSRDNTIIIYNLEIYLPDIIIKEHNDSVCCITQLSSGILASCSEDKTIKLFNIKEMKYDILQTLNYHTSSVCKIIELKNKNLVSCSNDSSIIFYIKDNNEYKKDYQIQTDGYCYEIIQTKDNELCYSEYNNNKICFYDLFERKIISSIKDISKNNSNETFIMIKKDLLLIPGNNQISIINTNQHNLVRKIEVPGSSYIFGVCMLNKNMLLTGDCSYTLRQ